MIKHGIGAWVRKLCDCRYCHEAMRLRSEKNNRRRGVGPSSFPTFSLADLKYVLDANLTNREVADILKADISRVYNYRVSVGMTVRNPRLRLTKTQEEILARNTLNEVCAEELGIKVRRVVELRQSRRLPYPGRVSNYVSRSRAAELGETWRPRGFS